MTDQTNLISEHNHQKDASILIVVWIELI